jgi:hypothetical protein
MKTGRKSKDRDITENFNTQKKGTEGIRAIKKQIKTVEQQLQRKKDQEEKKAQKKKEREDEKKIPTEADNEKAALQMLSHLRYAYLNSVGSNGKKGRARLLELMKGDADFKSMMKELIKIETSLASAKIKAKENGITGGNTTTFVILKGLHDTPDIEMKQVEGVDMPQVISALNPENVLEKVEYIPDDIARPEGR